jgi:formylmethanofuran dehydrogenase subunit D
MPGINVTLLTGRTVDQGKGKECGKLSETYRESVAICEIDPIDMSELGIKENQNVKVTTDFGSTVVKAIESIRGPHPKIVYIPYGPWASLLMNPRTHSTGMPTLKGIPARIEFSPTEKVLDVYSLLKERYKKR